MDVLECFYKPQHRESSQTLSMLQHVLSRYEDIILVANNVETAAGKRRAHAHQITAVPTTVVNREHVIEGVPYSFEDVLRRMNG
jgi:hypothetical protein